MVYMSEQSAHKHAIISAYLSIIAGLVEAVLSLLAGHAEISMSLYGIALMAIVDITGSVLVLKMWQSDTKPEDRLKSDRIKEMEYSITIGVLMIILGTFLSIDSLKNLSQRESPDDGNIMGTSVTIFGAVCGLYLAAYKYIVGKALDSPVVVADSLSSLCSGITSVGALVVVLIDDRLWWSDSTAGFTAALYTLYSGVSTVTHARSEIVELQRSLNGGPRLAPQHIKKILGSKDNYRSVQENVTSYHSGTDGGKFIEIRSSGFSRLLTRMNIFNRSSDIIDGDRVPMLGSVYGEDEVTFSA